MRSNQRRPRPGRSTTRRHHRPGTGLTRTLRPAERVVWLDTDVARQLSVPLAEARAFMRDGAIPAERINGVWTTTRARVVAFIDSLPEAGPDDFPPPNDDRADRS
ncbi:hypothetical protein [Parafrankia sp. FMc2]|uniref:hypothetical protein n=1 Tax=Parafrankia sp. FMc2 TaxID=3233196 RepID=UPI0034D78535